MKKQLIKLALLGLLSNFGYGNNIYPDESFDINRDGKRDKVDNINYFISYDNKKIYRPNLFIPNQDGSTVIPKYRNKKISDNVEYTLGISGGKKYSFILKKYNKVNAKGIFEDTSNWDENLKSLPKNAKGFKIRIVPNGTSYMYDLYVNYINGKFYITKISEHSGNGGCIHTLVTKFTLPKTIDIDTFDELMLEKRNTKKCLDRSGYGEKGYNLKLEAEIYDIR